MTSNGAVSLNHSESPISSDSKVGSFRARMSQGYIPTLKIIKIRQNSRKLLFFLFKNTISYSNNDIQK